MAVEVCDKATLQATEETLRVFVRLVGLDVRLCAGVCFVTETRRRPPARAPGAVKVRRAGDERVREEKEQRQRQPARTCVALSMILLNVEFQTETLKRSSLLKLARL